MFSLYIDWILVLIASVPGLCILFTFVSCQLMLQKYFTVLTMFVHFTCLPIMHFMLASNAYLKMASANSRYRSLQILFSPLQFIIRLRR